MRHSTQGGRRAAAGTAGATGVPERQQRVVRQTEALGMSVMPRAIAWSESHVLFVDAAGGDEVLRIHDAASGAPLGRSRDWPRLSRGRMPFATDGTLFLWSDRERLAASPIAEPGAILWSLERTEIRGAVNAVAPAPVSNRELTETLSRVLRRPAIVPVPGFALRSLLGPLAGELLGSRRVVPARLLASGFTFRHATLESALAEELKG